MIMYGLFFKVINWRNIKVDGLGSIWVGMFNGLVVFVWLMFDNNIDQLLLLQVEFFKGVVYEKASNCFEVDMDDYFLVCYFSVGYLFMFIEYCI